VLIEKSKDPEIKSCFGGPLVTGFGGIQKRKWRLFCLTFRDKVWWGLFDRDELQSRAGLNSKGQDIGQVGGVFTPKKYRQRGYAKATMLHMLKDCRDTHVHRKNLLFTGETDYPAQKLYESIGYQRIGSFALILG
jgi:predicted GNAT family acetyltransferase